MLRLSLKYIRFFKEQSLYVLLGIIVTMAILTAIGGAFDTNNQIALERAREIHGDYHYWYNKLSKDELERGLELQKETQIEKVGYMCSGRVYNALDNPTVVGLKATDPGYREMAGLKLLEGDYPDQAGEIALEESVLAYFTEEGLGTQIALIEQGKTDTYTVVGIFQDREEDKGQGQKTGYVSEADTQDGYYQLFVKFNEKKDIRKLEKDFRKKAGYEKEGILNRDLLDKLDYEKYHVKGEEEIDLQATADQAGAEYGRNFKEWLAGTGTNKALGTIFVTIFSMIILYSIFHISIQQRSVEYGKMEAFGIEGRDLMILLGSELFVLFLIGFPIGIILGELIVWGMYQYYLGNELIQISVSYIESISWKTILINAGLLLLILLIIAFLATVRLDRMNVIETIRGEKEKKKPTRFFFFKSSRRGSRIWSKKTDVMMPVVLFKQFLEKKGRVITMIFMLSMGGMIYLVGSYVEEQTIRNNRLEQITNSGTNADIRVSIENTRFSNDIGEEQVNRIKELPEVKLVEPVGFYLGGILLKKDQIRKRFTENTYWETLDKYSPIFVDMGGILAEESPGNYNLKSEIYGYDDAMLEDLKDFVLDGEIDSVKQEDTVILQTVANGVGDWDILKLRAGDQITVRFPKESPGLITDEKMQLLGMVPKGDYTDDYEEKTFTIGAVVKGGIADNQGFLTAGYGSDVGIILPNDRFHEIFDADGYNMVSVQLKDKKTADEAARKIRSITKGIEGISVIDFTDEIVRNQEYLDQTMILVRIIVLLLLAIGFFNTISSVNYMLFEKRKEFVVMRAMGITDVQLTRTMFGEGVAYGVIVSVLMIVFTLLVQIPVKYFLDHGFVYLNAQYTFNWPLAFLVAGVNILLCVIAVILPAKRILFHEITEELSDI